MAAPPPAPRATLLPTWEAGRGAWPPAAVTLVFHGLLAKAPHSSRRPRQQDSSRSQCVWGGGAGQSSPPSKEGAPPAAKCHQGGAGSTNASGRQRKINPGDRWTTSWGASLTPHLQYPSTAVEGSSHGELVPPLPHRTKAGKHAEASPHNCPGTKKKTPEQLIIKPLPLPLPLPTTLC